MIFQHTEDFLNINVIKYQHCPHLETSQLICSANQLTGSYKGATLALNGLKALLLKITVAEV